MIVLKTYEHGHYISDFYDWLAFMSILLAVVSVGLAILIIINYESEFFLALLTVFFFAILFIGTGIYTYKTKRTTEQAYQVIFNEMTMEEINEKYEILEIDWPIFKVVEKQTEGE